VRSGVLVIDKPAGPTSHDVVDRVRRLVGVRRVGHAGTLDPFATGVLPVCVGSMARLSRFLTGTSKRYLARVRFGFATDTDDCTGNPLGPAAAVSLDRSALAAACRSFIGDVEQAVPAYSAKRVAGSRLYERARRGEAVVVPRTRVRIDSLEIESVGPDWVALDVKCSAGTYVRSLARDLGESLGCGAHLTALRRTESGGFTLEDAVPLEELDRRLESAWASPDRILAGFPRVDMTAEQCTRVRHGADVVVAPIDGAAPSHWVGLFGPAGDLIGVGRVSAAPAFPSGVTIHPEVVLAEAFDGGRRTR
jgi:tRNA pseudouridine55 synthase